MARFNAQNPYTEKDKIVGLTTKDAVMFEAVTSLIQMTHCSFQQCNLKKK